MSESPPPEGAARGGPPGGSGRPRPAVDVLGPDGPRPVNGTATAYDPGDSSGDPETRGATRLSPVVVEKIARRAAGEVASVVATGTPIAGGGLAPAPRARAEVRGGEAQVAISVPVHYPVPLRDVGAHVRERVVDRVLELTGLRVTTVDVEAAPMRVERQQRRVV